MLHISCFMSCCFVAWLLSCFCASFHAPFNIFVDVRRGPALTSADTTGMRSQKRKADTDQGNMDHVFSWSSCLTFHAMLDVMLHVMLHALDPRLMFHLMLHVLLHVVVPCSCHVSCPRHVFCMLYVLLYIMLHVSYHKSSTSRCMFHLMLHVLLHVVLPCSCHVWCPRHEFCCMIHASCFMPHFELRDSCFIPHTLLFRESRFICHEAFVACL